MTIDERLRKIMDDLDAAADDLEDAGFSDQAHALDSAAGKIEDVANAFESL
ncbi:MAG: hypothetical protein ABR987_06670 [Terracidiphilus sp.]|jgi:hypothetical protein